MNMLPGSKISGFQNSLFIPFQLFRVGIKAGHKVRKLLLGPEILMQLFWISQAVESQEK